MVQRLLAARSEGESRAALFASWVVIAIQFTLFLIIGVCLFVLYSGNRLKLPDGRTGFIPLFIWQPAAGSALSGLVIAAILAAAMSNLSAALNALASTSIIDFYLQRSRKRTNDGECDFRALQPFVWALVLFSLAVLSLHKVGRVIEVGLADRVGSLWGIAWRIPARSAHPPSQ